VLDLGAVSTDELVRLRAALKEFNPDQPRDADGKWTSGDGASLEQRAKDAFGITNDIREAGYMTPDGSLLDFSGRHYASGYHKEGDRFVPDGRGQTRHTVPNQGRPIYTATPDYLAGQRNVDHRELSPLGMGSDEGMHAMLDAGFIRLMPDADGTINAEISRPMTASQTSALSVWAREAPSVTVEVTRGYDSLHVGSNDQWSDTPGKSWGSVIREANAAAIAASSATEATKAAMLWVTDRVLKAFDPSEPRDDSGKWTAGGGDLSVTHSGYNDTVHDTFRAASDAMVGMGNGSIARYVEQRTGVPVTLGGSRPNREAFREGMAQFIALHDAFPSVPVKAIEVSPMRPSNLLARTEWSGYHPESTIRLSSARWAQSNQQYGTPGWFTPENDNPAGTITHEFGHALDHAALFNRMGMAGDGTLRPGTPEYFRMGPFHDLPPISGYGATSDGERFAELFAATYAAPTAPPDQMAAMHAYATAITGSSLGKAASPLTFADEARRVLRRAYAKVYAAARAAAFNTADEASVEMDDPSDEDQAAIEQDDQEAWGQLDPGTVDDDFEEGEVDDSGDELDDGYDALDAQGQAAVAAYASDRTDNLLGLGALLMGGLASAAQLDNWLGTYASGLHGLWQIGFGDGAAAAADASGQEVTTATWESEDDGGTCFVAGTMIATPDGSRAIEGILPGDLVLSPIGPRRVVATSIRPYHGKLAAVEAPGLALVMTEGHPVFVNGHWRAAREILPGDRLEDAEHEGVLVRGSYQVDLRDVCHLPPDGPEARVLQGVLGRAVPVEAVHFEGDPVDREVNAVPVLRDASADLWRVDDAQPGKALMDSALQRRLAPVAVVAAGRAEQAMLSVARSRAPDRSAGDAREHGGGPSAGFGAVTATGSERELTPAAWAGEWPVASLDDARGAPYKPMRHGSRDREVCPADPAWPFRPDTRASRTA
jgi:hypothetical protein